MTWDTLTTFLVLAVIVEFSTEIFKNLLPSIRGHYSRLIAVLFGMILCLTTKSGILAGFNIHPLYPQVDYLITGLIISRGSNIIHDLVSKLDVSTVRR
jgi:type IV secretory pathway VirB2 component (pilin)